MLYFFNEFRFDPEQRILHRGESEVQLTPKTSDLLLVFLRNPGRVLSRQELLDEISPDTAVGYEALSFQVSELRKALGEHGGLVRTVQRHGYVWQGEGLREAPGEPEAPLPQRHDPSAAGRRIRWALPAVGGGIIAILFGVLYALRSPIERGPWVLAFSDDFERSEIGSEYQIEAGRWDLNYGGLRGGGSGSVSIDLVQRVEGNVRVEFDASVLSGSGKREIAVWLVSDHVNPTSGYYFGLGADHEVAELDRNFVEVKLAPAPALDSDRLYHASVVREGDRLEMTLNGAMVVSYSDPVALSPAATSIIEIGTFDGALRLDNLRVYRERVPAAIEPTVPADRIFERGDIDAAKVEYERVARDRDGEAVGGEALFKVGLCLLANHQPADAAGAFRAVADSAASRFYKHLAALDVGRSLAAMGDFEGAFQHLQKLDRDTPDEDGRYGIANELLQLAAQLGAHGRRAQAAEVRQYLVAHLASLSLLSERAASLVAIYGHEAPGDPAPLETYLNAYRRPGKPRLTVQRCLGMLQFMRGDTEAALRTFRAIEAEYAPINARFSLEGSFGQSLVLAAAGRLQEAEHVARTMPARIPGDNLPLRLFAEWQVAAKWLQGDLHGAITALDSEMATPHAPPEVSRFDPIDLALLYEESGAKERAAQLLRPLAKDDGSPVSTTASLFLGVVTPEQYAGDDGLPYAEHHLYLGRYYELRGQVANATAAYSAFDVREAKSFTPALCRAYVYLRKNERD